MRYTWIGLLAIRLMFCELVYGQLSNQLVGVKKETFCSDFLNINADKSPQVINDSAILLCEGESPRFSPDGNKVVCTLNWKVRMYDMISKHVEEIGHSFMEHNPSWSYDGKRIVFECKTEEGKPFKLWVMNSDGSNAQPLLETSSDDPENDHHPSCSLDGKYIVFSRALSNVNKSLAFAHGQYLWIADSNGRNVRILTRKPAEWYIYAGDWSPDSRSIVYLRGDDIPSRPPQAQIWTVGSNGEGDTTLIKNVRSDYVRWSADGKFLYCNDYYNIWKIAIDGKIPPQKVFDSHLEQSIGPFDISRDEQWLVYENMGIDDVESTIYLARINQTMKREGDKRK